ncbi:MAG: DUF4357 domain-containing protein [Rubinisphaera brasiliensis]|uniref:DUF4357 domain-containing protein n=1 Tax=Rubinisphaera brasiliensis TaxID=119 RepID=UPI0039195432
MPNNDLPLFSRNFGDFRCPSYGTEGGAVVNAGNINGRTAWKTEAGETYQQWHEKKLAAADTDVTE